MKTTAILNLKGGVGKTVTAVNLAYIWAVEHGKRVLLIDADSQCNATEFFLRADQPVTLYDVMHARTDIRMAICRTEYSGLDVVPADERLMELDISAVTGGTVNVRRLFSELADLDPEAYDLCLIDCPPSFTASCAAALCAADDVLIPIKLDAFSIRGMSNLYRQIASMRRINPRLSVAGCVETMWYNAPEMVDADKTLHGSILPVLPTRIRRSDRVDAMTFARQPLSIFSANSGAGIDYRALARDLLGGDRNGREI